MKRGKILFYIALFFLGLPLGLLGNNVQAAEISTEVTIMIHKRVFIDPKSDPKIQVNSGIELDVTDDLANPQKTYGLNGVVFEVYDATEYVRRLQEKHTNEEIQQAIVNTDPAVLKEELTTENKIGEVTTETVEGERGIATIMIENLTDEPTMILIMEKQLLSTNSTIRPIAVSMLISLPVEDPVKSNEFLSTVHLYPKSVVRGRLPQTGGETPVKPTPKPKPPGRLPQTGEAKTMIGLFGLLIVGTVSVIWFKRNSNKNTN